MTIYLVGHTKGGVGKTTTAVGLACSIAALPEREVALINGDRQNHAEQAIKNRPENLPPIFTASYPDGEVLRQQLKLLKGKYTDIVIDVGGRDTGALRAALMLTDVVIVPFKPRSFDAWSFEDIRPLVKETLASRDGLKVFTLLNCADPGGMGARDNVECMEYARTTFPEAELLPFTVGDRKAFSTAAAMGISIRALRPKNNDAIGEFDTLLYALNIPAPLF